MLAKLGLDRLRWRCVGRLSSGPASITELAQPFDMALPWFMKHIHLLEGSGWIQTRKKGRVRRCTLRKKRVADAEAWLSAQRRLWEGRTDRLERFVTTAFSLLKAGLIDELRLVIAPVVLGDGRRLFSGGAPTGLRLVDTRTTPGGLAIHTYQTAGSPRYATYQPGA